MKRMSFLKCYDVSKEVQKGVEVFCKESGHNPKLLKNNCMQNISAPKKSSKWVAKIIATFAAIFKL